MLGDYLKVRAIINSMNKSAQIVMCSGLIKRFHRKYLSEGHDLAMKLTGFLGGIAKERFS